MTEELNQRPAAAAADPLAPPASSMTMPLGTPPWPRLGGDQGHD